VVGAENDFIVDAEGVKETAQYFGVTPVFIPAAYHDLFLGPIWNDTAKVIKKWLENF
jgi:alpha-beta hydrolase superfamily lysophospholipase